MFSLAKETHPDWHSNVDVMKSFQNQRVLLAKAKKKVDCATCKEKALKKRLQDLVENDRLLDAVLHDATIIKGRFSVEKSKLSNVEWNDTYQTLHLWWVYPLMSSPIWRRWVRRQITPRRGWWTCVLWVNIRSQHKRRVGILRREGLVWKLVTMVTVVQGVGQAVYKGHFCSLLGIFHPFLFLFHSSILEPSLNLWDIINKRFTAVAFKFDRWLRQVSITKLKVKSHSNLLLCLCKFRYISDLAAGNLGICGERSNCYVTMATLCRSKYQTA